MDFKCPDGKSLPTETVKQIGTSGHWRSRIAQEDVLAVRADAGQDAGLWIDASFQGRIFPVRPAQVRAETRSNRVLKMPSRPCTVIAVDQP